MFTVFFVVSKEQERLMGKSKKTTRYILDASCPFDDGNGNAEVWFMGNRAVVAERHAEIVAPFCSFRRLRTANKTKRVRDSLEKQNLNVLVFKITVYRKHGKITRVKRIVYK